MPSTFFKQLYDEAENGVDASSIPAGTYDVTITAARPLVKSSLIFLTLRVLNGASVNAETDVSLYFPGEGSKRGARIYFTKKVAGFVAYPDVKAAFEAADNAPTIEAGFDSIASALVGKNVTAEIGLRTDGDYKGSNELRATRAAGGAAPAVSAQTELQAPVPEPAGVNGQGSTQVPF